jgi:GT2 family glycosyltransferase
LIFPATARIQHAGLVPTLWGYLSNYGVGAAAGDARFAGSNDRAAVSGAALCLRRDRFDAAGGFDESYRWGYEDADLCFRLRERGHRIVCVGAGASEHRESATLRDRREPADLAHNYGIYRRRWAHWIAPREQAYVEWLRSRGICRVVVFGAGVAAAALFEALQRTGVETVAFATSAPDARGSLCERPIVTLDEVPALSFDRLIAGSQFFFEVEPRLRALDPAGEPLFPATWI